MLSTCEVLKNQTSSPQTSNYRSDDGVKHEAHLNEASGLRGFQGPVIGCRGLINQATVALHGGVEEGQRHRVHGYSLLNLPTSTSFLVILRLQVECLSWSLQRTRQGGCQRESMKKAIVSSVCICPGNRYLYMQESQPKRVKTHIRKRGRIGRKNKEHAIKKWVLFKCYVLLGFYWPTSSTPHTRALFQNLPTLAVFKGIIMLSSKIPFFIAQGNHQKATLQVVQLMDNPRIHCS